MSVHHPPAAPRQTAALACCLLAVGLSMLSGCATTPPPPPAGANHLLWQQKQRLLADMHSWKLKGKIGVKTDKKAGSATLLWDFMPGRQQIDLYGPFGGGRVKITANRHSAMLKDSKGRIIEGPTADEVLFIRLGWRIPFAQMTFWSRGLPDSLATDLVIDAKGRLKQLKQGNWLVTYRNYRTVTAIENAQPVTVELPRKLTIEALPGHLDLYSDQGESLGDRLRITVIFNRWWEIRVGGDRHPE